MVFFNCSHSRLFKRKALNTYLKELTMPIKFYLSCECFRKLNHSANCTANIDACKGKNSSIYFSNELHIHLHRFTHEDYFLSLQTKTVNGCFSVRSFVSNCRNHTPSAACKFSKRQHSKCSSLKLRVVDNDHSHHLALGKKDLLKYCPHICQDMTRNCLFHSMQLKAQYQDPKNCGKKRKKLKKCIQGGL